MGSCQGRGGSDYLWSTERHANIPRFHDLSEAYAERTLINDTSCPHRGTGLTGVAPDGAGVVTCSLHGCVGARDGRDRRGHADAMKAFLPEWRRRAYC